MVRKFIRHPADIPIEITPGSAAGSKTGALGDVSHGGLSFTSREHYGIGNLLTIRIPASRPPFETTVRVVWSREEDGRFVIGVEFLDKEDVFRMRMVEQVCHIEHYRNEVRRDEGRELTSEQAALEWINKCADVFPDPDDDASGKKS